MKKYVLTLEETRKSLSEQYGKPMFSMQEASELSKQPVDQLYASIHRMKIPTFRHPQSKFAFMTQEGVDKLLTIKRRVPKTLLKAPVPKRVVALSEKKADTKEEVMTASKISRAYTPAQLERIATIMREELEHKAAPLKELRSLKDLASDPRNKELIEAEIKRQNDGVIDDYRLYLKLERDINAIRNKAFLPHTYAIDGIA